MSSNNILRIAVIGGDGTGPEVTAEGVKVLKTVAKLENIPCEFEDFDLGGDRYLRTGEVLPPDVFERLRSFRSRSAKSSSIADRQFLIIFPNPTRRHSDSERPERAPVHGGEGNSGKRGAAVLGEQHK